MIDDTGHSGNVVAQQALALEQQIAEGIAELTGQDTDTGT